MLWSLFHAIAGYWSIFNLLFTSLSVPSFNRFSITANVLIQMHKLLFRSSLSWYWTKSCVNCSNSMFLLITGIDRQLWSLDFGFFLTLLYWLITRIRISLTLCCFFNSMLFYLFPVKAATFLTFYGSMIPGILFD